MTKAELVNFCIGHPDFNFETCSGPNRKVSESCDVPKVTSKREELETAVSAREVLILETSAEGEVMFPYGDRTADTVPESVWKQEAEKLALANPGTTYVAFQDDGSEQYAVWDTLEDCKANMLRLAALKPGTRFVACQVVTAVTVTVTPEWE